LLNEMIHSAIEMNPESEMFSALGIDDMAKSLKENAISFI